MSDGLDFIRSISKKEAATSWRREKKNNILKHLSQVADKKIVPTSCKLALSYDVYKWDIYIGTVVGKC